MDSIPWNWIFWGLVVFIAIRSLMSHTLVLRDHLRKLLMDHFEEAMTAYKKNQRIARIQRQMRAIREKQRGTYVDPETPPQEEKKAA